MKIYCLVLFIFSFSSLSSAQTAKEKTYVAYEPIMWNVDKKGNKTNTDFENPNKKWFHKNILKIKNDSIFLDRIPVSKIGNEILFSSSDGGFYYYKGIIINGTNIELTEISCDYCPVLVPVNKHERIPERKLFGKITQEGIEVNNVKFNENEYSEFLLKNEHSGNKNISKPR